MGPLGKMVLVLKPGSALIARSARNAIAALQKRLSHRNPNVQLYALEVSYSLIHDMLYEIQLTVSSSPIRLRRTAANHCWRSCLPETGRPPWRGS